MSHVINATMTPNGLVPDVNGTCQVSIQVEKTNNNELVAKMFFGGAPQALVYLTEENKVIGYTTFNLAPLPMVVNTIETMLAYFFSYNGL